MSNMIKLFAVFVWSILGIFSLPIMFVISFILMAVEQAEKDIGRKW